MFQRKYKDSDIAIWRSPGHVVLHFFGGVSVLQVSKMSAVLHLEAERSQSLACICVVDESADRPSPDAQKTFFEVIESLNTNNVVLANLFTARGFKGAVQRTVSSALTLRAKTEARVFSDSDILCEWLRNHRIIKSNISSTDLAAVFEKNAES